MIQKLIVASHRLLIGLAILSFTQAALAEDSEIAARRALAKQDYLTALPFVKSLATKGRPEFEFQYGRMLLRGLGVQRNTKQAFALISKAAAANYAPAERLLGDMYDAGEGTEADEQKAARAWSSAAAHGNLDAEHHLSGYYIGLGGSKNFDHGLQLLQHAAKQGDGCACIELAYLFYEGKPQYLEKDLAAARRWCEVGIKYKNIGCAILLARMYRQGEGGLPHDDVKAFLTATQFDRSAEVKAWRTRLSKANPSADDVKAASAWYRHRNTVQDRESKSDGELWDILNRR